MLLRCCLGFLTAIVAMHDLLTLSVNMLQTLVEIRLSLRLKRMLWLLRELAMTKAMKACLHADVFALSLTALAG